MTYFDHTLSGRVCLWSPTCAVGTEKRTTKNLQLVLQHCCKTNWITMLRVLPPTFKPVLQQKRLLTGLNMDATFNHQRTIRIQIHDHSWVFYQSLKKQAVVEMLVGTLSKLLRRRRQWKHHWTNEFASFQTLSRLFGTAQFVKFRLLFLELIVKGFIHVQIDKGKFFVVCPRPL